MTRSARIPQRPRLGALTSAELAAAQITTTGETKVKKNGRPSIYARSTVDYICQQLQDGATLSAVCREEGMPSEAAVRQWVFDDVDGLSARYAHARMLGYQCMADRIIDIADGATEWNTARLQIDTRKWMLSKALPKMFGDKVTTEISGPEGAPIQLQAVRDDPRPRLESYLAEWTSKQGAAALPAPIDPPAPAAHRVDAAPAPAPSAARTVQAPSAAPPRTAPARAEPKPAPWIAPAPPSWASGSGRDDRLEGQAFDDGV
jgi:hypothetical protein